MARQARLLLLLSAALAGFFLLLNFLASLVSSAPKDILAVNPSSEEYIGLSNGVELLEFVVLAASIVLALAAVFLTLRRPLGRASFKPTLSLAFGLLFAVAVVFAGAYLSFSGVLGRDIAYDEHSVHRSLLQSGGLAVLALFFLSMTVAGIVNRRLLLLVLGVWLVAAFAFGFRDTKPLDGLYLFERSSRLETPVAFTAIVERYVQTADFGVGTVAEATESDEAGESLPAEQSGAAPDTSGAKVSLEIGSTALQAREGVSEPLFLVAGAANTRYLRTATGDVYEDGEWRQLDPAILPVARGAAVLDEVVSLIEELRMLLIRQQDFPIRPYRLSAPLLAAPATIPYKVESDRITIAPVDELGSIEPGVVPISKHLRRINTTATYHPFSSTLSIPSSLADYEWDSSVPIFSLQDKKDAPAATDPTYLQLPDDIPERVHLLAEQFKGSDSAYLTANLIDVYLKDNYSYNDAEQGLEIEQPPAGQDPVDWFLFDHPIGDSGSFSSAFVVLARAAGVPARVVSGWAIEGVEETQIVYSNQAHQWAEIALQGVGWITFDPTPAALEEDYTLETALGELADSDDSEARAQAAEYLGGLREPLALPALVKALGSDESVGVQTAALTAIQRLNLFQLMWVLLNYDDPLIRTAAADGLRALEDLRALGALSQALASDEDAGVRIAAVNALTEIGKERATGQLLLAATSDRDHSVRVAAARALGELRVKQTAKQLVTVLDSDFHGEVREAAAWALGQIKDAVALRPLLNVLSSDENAPARSAADLALRRWSQPELVSLLGGARDPVQRAAAAEILGERGYVNAILALSRALRDPNESVREAAFDALHKFGEITWLEDGSGLLDRGLGNIALIPGPTALGATRPARTPVFELEGAANTNLLRVAVGDHYVDGRWLSREDVRLTISSDDEAALRPDVDPSLNATTIKQETISISRVEAGRHITAGLVPTSSRLKSVSISGVYWPNSSTYTIGFPTRGYTWESEVHTYSETVLERSGRWSTDSGYSYTELPEQAWVGRVRDLATRITAGHSTTYAKARAIEQYLRTEYTYRFAGSPEDTFPPPGRDPVDWFLFDRREGACGNFSSAFVVLARSIGIPARVVSGWAVAETPDSQIVYSDQAHQWAEVALDGPGWVAFDPTPGGAPSRVPSIEDEEAIGKALEDLAKAGGDAGTIEEALEALEKAGAEVTRLENGGALIDQGEALGMVAGTTTRQSSGLPHIPVFKVRGATHTGYLRTTVGDVYEDGSWRKLDPVSLPYMAGESVSDSVFGHYYRRAGAFASLPDWRLYTSSLFGFLTYSPNTAHEWIQILPAGAFTELPYGILPTSLVLEATDLNGVYYPFSSTFSSESSASSYTWTSQVITFTPEQYAAAAVTADTTYTQLPADLPDRIRRLALDITAGYSSPYAKAKALERYLSTRYTYGFADGSGRDEPPPGRDPMDWFLFDHREGTCGVFSSAFVVLARSVGIPARVVSGWMISATGEPQTVYADQAHQWAEVAFEGLGWVQFEPTASGGAPSRVAGETTFSGPLNTITNITYWPAEVRRKEPFIVRGTVNTLPGRAVSGMEIEIYLNETKEHGGELIGKTISRSGSFQAEVHIPAEMERGAYQLLARAVGNDQYNESWSDPDISVYSESGLKLTGPSEIPVDVEAVFEGRLSEDTGGGVAGRELNVTVDGHESSLVITGASGDFAFSRTFSEIGPHWVEVELAGEEFLLDNTVRLDLQVTLSTMTTVKAPVFVEVGEEFQVTGALRDARGRALAGENLYVRIGEGQAQTVTTDNSGQFEFTDSVFDTGEFTVHADFEGSGPVLPSEGMTRLVSRHDVALTLDGPDQVRQGDSGAFAGQLVSETYSPTGEVELTITSAQDSHVVTVTTDEAGRFEYEHLSFGNTGPHSLSASFPGEEYIASSSAIITFDVLAPTSLTINGPDVVREGERFELTGALLLRNGQPVPDASVQVSGDDSLSMVTDANGQFTWEAHAESADGRADAPLGPRVTFEVEFAGTDHLAPSRAITDVSIGRPLIVVEPPDPVARGAAAELRGRVYLGNRPSPGVRLAFGPDGSVTSNEDGTFTFSYPLGADLPLGTKEVAVSSDDLETSAIVPIQVKSASNLTVTPVEKLRPGRPALLKVTLLDDQGFGIQDATVKSSQGVEAVTDQFGEALLELTTPDSEELLAVPVTFTFDGDNRNMPLSTSYFLGAHVSPAGFNWLLFVGIPGLLALAVAGGYAGWRMRAVAVPNVIRRRVVGAAQPFEAPTPADQESLTEAEVIEGLKPTGLEIVFVKPAQDLPDVWGVGEEIIVTIGLADIEGQAIVGAAISVSMPGAEPASQATTDDDGVCILTWTADEQGEYTVSARFAGASGHLPSSLSRAFRVVDFREEIVRLYNEFLHWAENRTGTTLEQSTPREVELMLVSQGLPVAQKSLDELISRFEEADYSEHPIARRHYEAMFRAWSAVTEA